MLHFDSEYMEGAHPEILRRLVAGNLQKQPGYGADAICASARRRIRTACGCPDAAVYFLTGGTQVNTVVIDALLNPCQGVVAAESGHVNVHEAGAIERTGHKVLALRQTQGKLEAGTLEDYLAAFWRGAYREVQKEMKGRYPKHVWPDDPANTAPTRRSKKYS